MSEQVAKWQDAPMLPAIYYIAGVVLVVAVAISFAMKDGNAPLEPKRQRGAVGYVFDGDTLRLRGGQESRLRLWGVDAPETDQKGFHEAKIALERITLNRKITFIEIDRDRYGRIVARVFLSDGREVNRMMIESGTVKEYRRFSKGFYSWNTD